MIKKAMFTTFAMPSCRPMSRSAIGFGWGEKEREGQVDLVVSPADAVEQAHLRAAAPDGTVTAPIGEGVRVSIIVPEMRQAAGFDPAIAQAACAAMRDLVRWYPGARA